MNTHVWKSYLKSVIYNRNSDEYIWYNIMVVSWACEVTVIGTQKRIEDLGDLTSPTGNYYI